MTAVMEHRPAVVVAPIRQEVIDILVDHLARDEGDAFVAAQERLGATPAEVAAASAGLVASGQLDLAALEHTLEVLEGVVRLPGSSAL